MKIKKLRVYGNVQKWLLLGSFIINMAFFSIDAIYNLTSAYIHYFFILISVCMITINRRIKLEKKVIVYFILIIILSICALILNKSGMGNVAHFFWPITIMLTYKNGKHDQNFFAWLSLISRFFFYFLVLKAIFVYSKIDTSSLREIHNSGVVNPNSAGMMLVLLFFCCNLSYKQIPWRIQLFRLIAVSVGLLFCDSRGPLLAVALIILLSVFCKQLIKKSSSFMLMVFFAIISVGSLFPIIYVSIFKLGVLNNFEIMGKSLFTGREWIWINIFNYVKEHKMAYFIGTGYNTSFYTTAFSSEGTFNPHNAYMMLFALFGLPVTIMYFSFMIIIIKKAYNKGPLSEVQVQAIWILMVACITGFFETTFSYIPVLIFPGIALGILYDKKEASINVNSQDNPLLLVWAFAKRR
jgi:hypothetical protein